MLDPHGVGAAVARLSNGPKKTGRVAFGILTALLDSGETVECIVQGRVNECDGLVALTSERIVFLNDRTWKPDLLYLPVDAGITVQGWQDDRTAALVFTSGNRQATIDRIVDRPLAQEMAQRVRGRATQAPAG
jgi:hypothetical protein